MLKSVARATLLTKRQSLTEADCIKLDDLLLIQLQRLDWSSTKIIGSFFPGTEIGLRPTTILLRTSAYSFENKECLDSLVIAGYNPRCIQKTQSGDFTVSLQKITG